MTVTVSMEIISMKTRFFALCILACLFLYGTVQPLSAQTQAAFDPLFRLANVKGACSVRAPEKAAFEPAINEKAYPYGTSIQIGLNSEAVILFSKDNSIQLIGPAEATVAVQTNDVNGRILFLYKGEARTFADESLPETALIVETPLVSCDAFTGGRTTIKADVTKDGTIVSRVEAAAGSTRITGSQFSVPTLKSSCCINITSTPDRSLSKLTNLSGEYQIELDNGTDVPVIFDSTLKSSVKIWREYAPVGDRLIVAIFAIGPDGKGKECYAFAVGQPAVNASGMPMSDDDVSKVLEGASAPESGATADGSIF